MAKKKAKKKVKSNSPAAVYKRAVGVLKKSAAKKKAAVKTAPKKKKAPAKKQKPIVDVLPDHVEVYEPEDDIPLDMSHQSEQFDDLEDDNWDDDLDDEQEQ